MQKKRSSVEQLLLNYACALRTHRLEDAAVIDRLVGLGLSPPEASQFIVQMDQMGWTADSNSRVTGIGWLSILFAVGVTGASGYLLSRYVAISLGVVKIIFVLPFVGLGFIAHVGLAKLLERAGIHTSVSKPITIPDEEQLRRILAEAREGSASQAGNG
jgi:hypothetical protein